MTIRVSLAFAQDFKARCEKMPKGCLSYMGAHTVRIPLDMTADTEVEFVSPRRAAYIIKNKMMPTRDIKLLCHTPTCVNTDHFIEGRERRSSPVKITSEIKKGILKDLADGETQQKVADKYGVSRQTIRRIKEQ